MSLASGKRVGLQASKVGDVLGDERAILAESDGEELVIGGALEPTDTSRRGGASLEEAALPLEHLLELLGLLLDHSDPAVDLVRIG